MSMLSALATAQAASVRIGVDGADLVLEAATQPPARVIELLSRHKDEIVAWLSAVDDEKEESKPIVQTCQADDVVQQPKDEPEIEAPCASRRGRVKETGGRLLHFCSVCGRFGSFGWGVRLRAGHIGRWYCYEHDLKK